MKVEETRVSPFLIHFISLFFSRNLAKNGSRLLPFSLLPEDVKTSEQHGKIYVFTFIGDGVRTERVSRCKISTVCLA